MCSLMRGDSRNGRVLSVIHRSHHSSSTTNISAPHLSEIIWHSSMGKMFWQSGHLAMNIFGSKVEGLISVLYMFMLLPPSP